MGDKELCEVALRVLRAWTYCELPDFYDLERLRSSCLPEEKAVPIDELACRVISRECERVIRQSQSERKEIESGRSRKKIA